MMRSPSMCGAACARAYNFQRHFLWLNIKKRGKNEQRANTISHNFQWSFFSSFFFMPGHNFILLALRGNLLDFRSIKRQFLQLTRDDFSSTCSRCSIWLLPFFIPFPPSFFYYFSFTQTLAIFCGP